MLPNCRVWPGFSPEFQTVCPLGHLTHPLCVKQKTETSHVQHRTPAPLYCLPVPLQPASPHFMSPASPWLLRQKLGGYPPFYLFLASSPSGFRMQRICSLLTTSFYHSSMSRYHFSAGFMVKISKWSLCFKLQSSVAFSEQRIQTYPWEIKRLLSSAQKLQAAAHFSLSKCHGSYGGYQ